MHRYGKIHASVIAHLDAKALFHRHTDWQLDVYSLHTPFARAMPEYLKFDEGITDIEAYRRYLVFHKPWAGWKVEDRKPTWWDSSLYPNVDHELSRTV
jgi:hypothetical protein